MFSVGCCQSVNQNPTPDRRQNSRRLQINVGCNSTAICPRLQLLTASPTSPKKLPPFSTQNPTSDSCSALTRRPPPPTVSVCVCVWAESWQTARRMNLCGDSFNRRSNKVLFCSLLLLFVVPSSSEVCGRKEQNIFTWMNREGAFIRPDRASHQKQKHRERRVAPERHHMFLSYSEGFQSKNPTLESN